jgi:hypothetical protein
LKVSGETLAIRNRRSDDEKGEHMGICTDSRLTFLNNLGYNVVRLPREGIEPLQALGRDPRENTIENLGAISAIWKAESDPPVPDPPTDAPNINGQRTDDLKLSVGLDILAGVLSGMGVPGPKLDLAYTKARSVQFEFVNVKVHRIEPLKVGEYLADGDLKLANPFSTFFTDPKKTAFVITEVLKSDAIKVTAKGKGGVTVGVDVQNIQGVLGTKATVGAEAGADHTLTYQGTKMLTFGFKVFGIAFMEGEWRVFGVKPAKDLAFAAPGMLSSGASEIAAPASDTAILLGTSGLLDLG